MSDAAKKVFFKLPDLEPAPASDVGMLARRLLEGGDLTAFPPLLEALAEAGRHDDARELRRDVAYLMHGVARRIGRGALHIHDWMEFVSRVIPFVWWDLFDMSASLAALDEAIGPRKAKGREEALRRLADVVHQGSLIRFPPGQPVGDLAVNSAFPPYHFNLEGDSDDPADRPDR